MPALLREPRLAGMRSGTRRSQAHPLTRPTGERLQHFCAAQCVTRTLRMHHVPRNT